MTKHPMPSGNPAAETENKPAGDEPRWALSTAAHQLTREELLARYRRERGLQDDPFEHPASPSTPAQYRSTTKPEVRAAARFKRVKPEMEAPGGFMASLSGRSLNLGQTFAVAAAIGLASGAAVGFINAKLSASSAPQDSAIVTPMLPLETHAALATEPSQPASPTTTTMQKKSVPMATLRVSDVTGETNSFIPLALQAAPANLDGDILLKISGIPENSYLTTGQRGEDEAWALSLADLKNVKLVVPEAQQAEIDLSVAAIERKTGELAAPVKTMTVALSDVIVEPASAPPPGQKSPLPGTVAKDQEAALLTAEAIRTSAETATDATTDRAQLIEQADSLLKEGDLRAARSAYQMAWNQGSAVGAFGLGRSYDPVVLASLDVNGAKPDKSKALQWYERAASAGHTAAAGAIVRLKLKP